MKRLGALYSEGSNRRRQYENNNYTWSKPQRLNLSHCPYAGRKINGEMTDALDEADVIILASPVYVYHATGAMKAFLDHYGYRWMVHCPEESMFKKQGVCISTAAGAGTKSTNKDMEDSLFFWGVAKRYKYGVSVAAVNWKGVSDKKKSTIDKATSKMAKKIVNNYGHVKPGIKTRGFFWLMHLVQRKGFNPCDVEYWKAKGWTGKKRPWK